MMPTSAQSVRRYGFVMLFGGSPWRGRSVLTTAALSSGRRTCRHLTLLIARITVGFAVFLAPAISQTLPRTVLYLDEGTANNPAPQEIVKAFQSTLNADSGNSVSLYFESLGIPVFANTRYFDFLRDYFREKYRDRPIGLVIARGTTTLSYAVRLRDQLWPGVDLIFTAVDERAAAEMSLPPTVTGEAYQLHLQDIVDAARVVVPRLGKIVIVGERLDSKNNLRRYINDVPDVAAKIQVIDLTNLPLPEALKRAATLPDDAAIAYVSLRVDSAGAVYNPRDVLRSLAEVANRPIVIDTEETIGLGATGGFVNTYDAIGKSTARLAWRILNGEKASSIPVSVGDYTKWVFDWRQLQRWGINEDQLPAGSEIRFRPPTAWEQYRWQIILLGAALLAQSLLIAGLVLERRRRRQAEIQVRQKMAELAHMNRSAAAGEISASIAHEINQPLAAIVLSGNVGLRWLANATPDLEKASAALKRIVSDGHRASEIVATIRAMFKKEVQKQNPVDVNQIIREVLALLHIEMEASRVVLTMALAGDLPRVLGDRTQLQQVILNLVRNALDAMTSVNGRARTLRVRSEWSKAGNVVVSISDSGTGIEPANLDRIFEPFFTTKATGMGMGLSICRSIVEDHGGRLSAAPGSLYGSVFEIVLPELPQGAVT
jgi:signal transduction histidine kinase/ABC-type uncharacterized transport system substrate-binding protein